MILASCGGRGNGGKDAEGLARAESREGSGRWGGWTGKRGDREWETGRGNLEGGNGEWGDGEGSNRGGKKVAMGSWTTRGGDREGGNGEGGGRWEGGNGEGGKVKEVGMGGGEEGPRGGKISQMDMMRCLDGHRL